jgi:hypothetical protein
MTKQAEQLRTELAGKLSDCMTVLQARNINMQWNDFSTIRTDSELQIAIRYCDNPQHSPFSNCNAFRIIHAAPFAIIYGTGANTQ